MNYLIVCPRFVNDEDEYFTFAHGVAYVSSSLKTSRKSVFTLNLNYSDNDLKAIKDSILNYSIDVFIIGGTSRTYKQIKQILSYVKEIKKDVITIIGGGLLTAAPETAMKALKCADIGIVGEGEETIIEIADFLETGKNLGSIKGILYREKDGVVIKTDKRDDIKDLDKIPFPDYDGFQYGKQIEKTKTAMICTSRSCPYNCTFCFHTCGNTYRSRSLDNVFEEIEFLFSRYEIEVLSIADELFVAKKSRVIEFCNRIKPYNVKWTAQARVDGVDLEILEKMRDAGCIGISYGLESASNEILKGMKKKTTIEQIEKAFEITRKAKIKPFGNFLFGDINETVETSNMTIEWYSEHPYFDCSFCQIIILPGSEIYKYALENNFIKNEIEYWENDFPYTNVTRMTHEEYERQYNRLIEAKKEKLWLPQKIDVKEINKSSKFVSLEIVCDVCGHEFQANSSSFGWDDQKAHLCPRCNQSYNLPLSVVLSDKLNNSINKKCATNKILIYGMGLITRRIMSVCQALNNENVILIDSNTSIQNDGVNGKKVFDKSILSEYSETELVIGVSEFVNYDSILKTIEDAFPNKFKVMKLDEFLFSII